MGLDYAMVHVTYNIPLASLMTLFYWPFFTPSDRSKLVTMVAIAVLATIPWDSYLVRNHIWTYPASAVTGMTLFSIPVEEVFFFGIQTYNTGLLYIILTKRLVLLTYLKGPNRIWARNLGALLLVAGILFGIGGFIAGGKYTYFGLILAWGCPFILIQWIYSWRFLLAFPRLELLASVWLPTIYLWVVDGLSLKRGTWVITDMTKVDIQVWTHLDAEEAFFFLITNVMIVGGLVAIDHAIALVHLQIATSPGSMSNLPAFGKLLTAFTIRNDPKDSQFIQSLSNSVQTVASASQSMYMGSSMFQGQLRVDLIFLYSFCRITDDLVDEAPDRATARTLIDQSRQLLDFKFASSGPGLLNSVKAQNEKHTKNQYIPQSLISAVERLPSTRLNSHHLHGLLQGFVTDLEFDAEKGSFPIATEEHLESYALHVAGTVAASVLELVLSHYPEHISAKDHALRQRVVAAGKGMGQALQYVNIARDIERDALIQRVYLPATWLYKEGLTPADVIAEPCNPKILLPKQRMLDKADECARAAEGAIAYLPTGIQGPVRATVESYMAIGTELRKPGIHCLRGGKIKLPLWRRLYVAYSAMARSQVAA